MSDPALAEAVKQASKGRPVFPVSRSKRPLTPNGFKDATTDAAQILRWAKKHHGCGWAMATGEASGVVVIDVDPGGDADPLNLPATMTVVTGRGGKHVYLKHPGAGTKVPNSQGKLREHIDVRGDGGYVVLPGSENEAGRYRLVGNRRGMAPLPTGVLSRLLTPSNGSAADHVGDGPYTAGGRHKALVSFAGVLRSDPRTNHAMLLAGLRAFNAENCDPPKDDDEVARIAADYASKDTRVERVKAEIRAREQARIEIAREEADAVPMELPLGTAADYLAEGDEEIAYTIDRWHTTGGNTLIVSQGKVGKTTLGVNLMKSLADGVPFLGRYDVEFDGRVAYLDYEMNRPVFKHWLRGVGVDDLDRLVEPWHLRGKPNPLLHEERVAEWLRGHQVKAWIVDAAMGAWSGYVTNENSNSEVDAFTKALDRIKEAAGVEDLFLLHHMGAAQFAEGEERGRGATRLEHWADHIWLYTKKDGSRSMWCKGRGVDVPADQAIDIQYSAETHQLMAGATRAARRQDEAAYAALAALDAYPEKNPKTAEWTVTIRPAEFKGRYRAAIDEGWIEQYTDGRAKRCKITKEGRQALRRRVSRDV
jgi:hypothetical protein